MENEESIQWSESLLNERSKNLLSEVFGEVSNLVKEENNSPKEENTNPPIENNLHSKKEKTSSSSNQFYKSKLKITFLDSSDESSNEEDKNLKVGYFKLNAKKKKKIKEYLNGIQSTRQK